MTLLRPLYAMLLLLALLSGRVAHAQTTLLGPGECCTCVAAVCHDAEGFACPDVGCTIVPQAACDGVGIGDPCATFTETPTPTTTPTPAPTATPTICGGATTLYWSPDCGTAGNYDLCDPACWSCTSGGSGGAGIPVNRDRNARIDANSITQAGVTITMTCSGIVGPSGFQELHSMDWTGVLHTPTYDPSETVFFGDLTFAAGMTVVASGCFNSIDFSDPSGGGTTHLLDAGGQTLCDIVVGRDSGDGESGAGPTVRLTTPLTYTSNIDVVWGTFDANGKTLHGNGMIVPDADPIITGLLINDSTVILTAGDGAERINFSVGAQTTYNLTGSTISMSDDGGTILGAGLTLPSVTLTSASHSGVDIGAAIVITSFMIEPAVVWDISSSGVSVDTLSGNGTAGNLVDFSGGGNLLTVNNIPVLDYWTVSNSGCCVGAGCPATSVSPCYAGSHGSVDATSGAAYDPDTGLGGWLAEDAPATPTPTFTPTPAPTGCIAIPTECPGESAGACDNVDQVTGEAACAALTATPGCEGCSWTANTGCSDPMQPGATCVAGSTPTPTPTVAATSTPTSTPTAAPFSVTGGSGVPRVGWFTVGITDDEEGMAFPLTCCFTHLTMAVQSGSVASLAAKGHVIFSTMAGKLEFTQTWATHQPLYGPEGPCVVGPFSFTQSGDGEARVTMGCEGY